MLFDKLEKYSSRSAVISENSEVLTFFDLIKLAKQIGTKIKKRSLVFILTENCVESVAGYIAFVRSNCVVMLVSSQITSGEFDTLYQKYIPDFLWCNKKNSLKLSKKNFSSILYIGNFQLLESKKNFFFNMNENLMLLLSTSGSLGDPKCVKLSYKNITSNSLSIIDYLTIENIDRAITTLPMNYSYGLSIINTHLFAGASIILNKKTLIDKSFWKLFYDCEVNNFNGVPYTFEILKKIGISKIFSKNLKYITQAGGKMNTKRILEIEKECANNSTKFFIMYGQTEASPRMSYLEISKLLNKYESIGKPISGGQFWIENKKGNKINKNNEIGELIYSGDNVFMGYSNSYHDLNKKDEVHGVLKTGDLVKKDNEGFYFIVGRKKRFIKLYGDRVSLDYLENKLQSKNYNAACTGSDDKLVIFCEKKKTKKINKSKIAEVVNIIASRFKLIEIENLPKNQNKKISYIHLNKLINNE
tara:strand:- start:3688 stop:5109 length:1422 start_codon:yes stop_codon:yes gene_type:complete